MIMIVNWLISIITFGVVSLATITMTNTDEYSYETQDGITLAMLFGEQETGIYPNLYDHTSSWTISGTSVCYYTTAEAYTYVHGEFTAPTFSYPATPTCYNQTDTYEAGTYTFQIKAYTDVVVGDNETITIEYYDTSDTLITTDTISSLTTTETLYYFTNTITEDFYIKITLTMVVDSITQNTIYFNDIQLEEGSYATGFVKYGNQKEIERRDTQLLHTDYTYEEVFGEETLFDGTGMNLYYRDYNDVVQSASLINTSRDDTWTSGGAFAIVASELSSLNIKNPASSSVISNSRLIINGEIYTNVADTDFTNQDGNNAFSILIGNLYLAFNDLSGKGITKDDTASAEAYLQANDVEFIYESNVVPTVEYHDSDNFIKYDLAVIYNDSQYQTQAQFEEDMAEWEMNINPSMIFGIGNEPTTNDLQTWYDLYQTAITTNQHDYTYTLNALELEDIVFLVSSAFIWIFGIYIFKEVL